MVQKSSELRRGSNQEREDWEVDDFPRARRIVVDAVAQEDQVGNGSETFSCESNQVTFAMGDVFDANCLLELLKSLD